MGTSSPYLSVGCDKLLAGGWDLHAVNVYVTYEPKPERHTVIPTDNLGSISMSHDH
jgi:hypothetical protein